MDTEIGRTKGGPGERMASEIAEQPAVWRTVLARRGALNAAGKSIAAFAPRFVLFAARGTSDHAALYGKYLVEILHRLPAGLTSPSTITVYGATPALQGVLLVAISQSGESPDLLRTVEAARRGGALTVAITNNTGSPLARAAAISLDLAAGTERAVAATKSYSAQLMTLYLLLEAWRGGTGDAAEALPDLGEAVLAQARATPMRCVERYRFAQRLVVTGRGYAYPTAREAALKLMETSYLSAQAFSGADLLHGPLAMLDTQVPVLAVVPAGRGGAAMEPVLTRVRQAGADLFVVGNAADVAGADDGFPLPGGAAEELSPLLEIVPLQLLALRLALARGEDPDAPRGLRKVTETL
jgi:glucosamine--fructose-6-phosphate aminotransferase (isomerizing)